MNSVQLQDSFIYSVFGLFFITINKTILSFFNGMRYMILYAVFNALRAIFMIVFLLLFILFDYQIKYLTLIFTLPECLLSILLIIKVSKNIVFLTYIKLFKLSKLLFKHGNNAAIGHIVLDLNSKIDILILGLFTSDIMVGIYSFAAFVSDGFLQIFFVFRNNINPIITNIYFNRNKYLLEKVINLNIKKFYTLFTLLGICIMLFYPVFLYLFNVNKYYIENISVFAILLLGALLSSGYIPFQMIFNQIGKAKEQSKFLILFFLINICFNFLLVPLLGIYGAALAILISFLFQVYYIKKRIFKLISIKI